MSEKLAPLSDHTKAIILGSLLGDGSLKIHKGYKNARFSFRHSVVQKEYFFWKTTSLSEVSSVHHTWQQGTKGRDGWEREKLRYQSKALASLTELYHLTAKGKRFRIQRKWLNLLTPLSLAIWWCDDGSLVSDSRQGVFCTDGFSLDEVRTLDRYMKKVWGITTAVGRIGKTDQYRLWIRSTESLQKFLRIILPYIPVESMLSKVLMMYRDPHLQQRWISEVITHSPFSKRAVERQLKLKKEGWKQFRE